jgi:hypothetical protein
MESYKLCQPRTLRMGPRPIVLMLRSGSDGPGLTRMSQLKRARWVLRFMITMFSVWPRFARDTLKWNLRTMGRVRQAPDARELLHLVERSKLGIKGLHSCS